MSKNIGNTRVTLDAEHRKFANYYKTRGRTFEAQKRKLKKMEKEYNKLCSKLDNNCTGEEIKNKYMLSQEIETIQSEIGAIEKGKDEAQYYLNTSNILMDYYKDDKNENTDDLDNEIPESFEIEDDEEIKSTKISDFVQDSNLSDKKELFDKFKIITDKHYVEAQPKSKLNLCDRCQVEKTLIQSEGRLVCSVCGISECIIVDSEKPSYREHVQENSYFCYKRINHFNEWLSQFQAKESTEIPKEVYDSILEETKKMRIKDLRILTPDKIKRILKKLRLNKYYEHIPHIINKLNRLPPPILSRKMENKMRSMFVEIQLVFAEVCPPTRRNFLSYSYVLHKICELLELDEFLPCFPLLKSREKLNTQDRIWFDICEVLGYQYIPST